MNFEERLRTAINLEVPDRTPVVPLIYQFALKHKGRPIVPLAGGNPADWHKIIQAIEDTFDDLGGYDAIYAAGVTWPISSWRINSAPGNKYVSPGERGIQKDFSVQYEEREVMTLEDYDKIANVGWNEFLREYIPRVSGISIEQLDTVEKTLLNIYKKDAEKWRVRGIPVMSGALLISCEMTLSLVRSLPKFMLDIHRHRDRVKAALEAMTPDFIQNTFTDVKESGIPFVTFSLERGSGAYFNLKTFEELFFPELKKQVEAFAREGIISVLHMDTDWTLNLPYLKELPRGMCICELDSTSDIFKAKEILKNHMCIMGDVPASLLSLGNKEEVIAYCERLIDVVGKDGGYILSTGCECPPDARFENVVAMIDTAREHPVPRSR
ncbi:MAG: uroporphyrinogen decarboxylase family protein [Dehalococcoidia bacterium]|nr:uroporphyrinogen decarboxylase family protein [Dehalococcoidia bacterium]